MAILLDMTTVKVVTSPGKDQRVPVVTAMESSLMSMLDQAQVPRVERTTPWWTICTSWYRA